MGRESRIIEIIKGTQVFYKKKLRMNRDEILQTKNLI